MDKRQIDQVITTYISRIKPRINPQQVILYGSYAKGAATDYSDVDLLVLAESFEGVDADQRFDLLFDFAKGLRPDMQVYGLTPAEYAKASKLSLFEEIKKTGKVVYSAEQS